jgi:hypothetical protein
VTCPSHARGTSRCPRNDMALAPCPPGSGSAAFALADRVNPRFLIPTKGLFGKWRIQVDGRGLKGILRNFDL